MIPLTALWLPILLSAVAVFIASSIFHMLPLWHKNDFKELANQDQVLDALRPLAIPPGDYMLPRPANMKAMNSPEFREKLARGPKLSMTVIPPGPVSMGRSLILWFLYCVAVSVFAGYIAGRALGPGTAGPSVVRFAGCTAFVAYAVGTWQDSIWYWRAWSTTIKSTFDGLIYALLTGAVFAWLWPH